LNHRELNSLNVWIGFATLLVGSSATAHHAFTAQYDSNKPISIEGVIVKVEWMNPHAYFFVDTVDEATGETVTWACEMGAPAVLVRRGWTRNTLSIGETVTVDGVRARDGSNSMNAQNIVLTSTGQRLFTRSAGEQREAERAAADSGDRKDD
jgi:hypothetical protein